MPTYSEIMEQDFGALETAAQELEASADAFGEVAGNYRAQVASVPGHEDLWVGQSADAAHLEFSETEGELGAAEAEARSLAGVIRDGRAELVSFRSQVASLAAEITGEGFVITAEGRVENSPDWDTRNPLELQSLYETREQWQHRLDRAIEAVVQADDSLRLALVGVAEGEDGRRAGVFNGGGQDSTEEVLAGRAGDLANRLASGEELSRAELDELNRLMELESGDAEFSQLLLDDLGGDGFVDLSALIAGQVFGGEGERRASFLQLQEHLSAALASGTDLPAGEPGSHEYVEWMARRDHQFYTDFMTELHEAGVAGYQVESLTGQDVRGYQLVASMVDASGAEYSQRFLHDLTDGMRRAEDPSLGGDPGIWQLRTDDLQVDGLDEGERDWFALDPLDTMLGVMSHQPEVAAAYLDPAGGHQRLDYLINQREWDHLSMPMGTSAVAVPGDYAGFSEALLAATTGIPSGVDPVAHGLNLTEAGASVMESVVSVFAADPTLISDDGRFNAMSPELARMTAAYMGDFQADVSQLRLYSGHEQMLDLGEVDTVSFLAHLARDEEANGILTGAQQAFTALALDVELDRPLSEGITYSDVVLGAVGPGAQLAGILAEARADAVYDAAIAGDEEHNARVAMISDWTGVVLDEAVARAAQRYPAAGPLIEWGVGELSGSIFATLERDSSAQAAEDATDVYERGYQAAIDSSTNAVDLATRGMFGPDSEAPRHLANAAVSAINENFGLRIEWTPSAGGPE